MNFTDKNLDEIESLLAQSLKGHHHLFALHSVAKILSTPTEEIDFFKTENIDRIQELFSQLIKRESFQEKKHFLETLSQESYEILVRTYFHILDNTVLAAHPDKH